jgi:imidazolonepropionase-like amidohydrolase
VSKHQHHYRYWSKARGTFAASLGACLLIQTAAFGQSVLLSGATVHTVSGGILSRGKVLIKDGKIAAVGADVSADGAQTIDLAGQHLFPGLIALNTVVGLTEISGVRSTLDTTEAGDYTPDVESWIAVNPDSELIPVARANGIAYFQPVPHGGTVAGQSGLVAVEGWTTEQRTIKKPLALHVFWPSMELNISTRAGAKGKGKSKSLDEQARERRGKIRALQDFFEDAWAYAKAKDAAAKGSTPAPEVIPAWEAMLPYVRGQASIMIHADDARQIRAAVQWAATNKYQFVLAGGRDAWMVSDLLASHHVPVIYAHTFTLPGRDTDPYDVYFKAPSLLTKAGVKVIFSAGETSFDAPLAKNLPYVAAQAVAFGLPYEEALKGITLYPAQVAGVAERLGSIEAGKEATLFAADGDILDLRAQVTHLWFAGKEISLDNRHTRLYEKYKNRPKK